MDSIGGLSWVSRSTWDEAGGPSASRLERLGLKILRLGIISNASKESPGEVVSGVLAPRPVHGKSARDNARIPAHTEAKQGMQEREWVLEKVMVEAWG